MNEEEKRFLEEEGSTKKKKVHVLLEREREREKEKKRRKIGFTCSTGINKRLIMLNI